MKRLILLAVLTLFSLPAFSQLVVGPSDDGKAYQYAYGRANAKSQAGVGIVYTFSLDDGNQSTTLSDKDGNPLVFKSTWSCVNYMTVRGWKLVQILNLEYHEFLFRREVPEEEIPELTDNMLLNGKAPQ